MARKAAHVYAFEPAPHAADEIRKHVAANHFQNITLISSPVSDSEKSVKFSLTNVAYGSRVTESETKWPTLMLRTITLDDFVKTHPLPDFLKIDVEGEEARVLSGARSILQKNKTIICCELHSEDLAEQVKSILSGYGYKLTTLDREPFRIVRPVVAGELHVLAFPSKNED
jgi:FkbM family methyltransferase